MGEGAAAVSPRALLLLGAASSTAAAAATKVAMMGIVEGGVLNAVVACWMRVEAGS